MFIFHPDLQTATVEAVSARLWPLRYSVGTIITCTDLKGSQAQATITGVDIKSKSISLDFAEIQSVLNMRTKVLFQALPDKTYLTKLMEIVPLLPIKKIFLFHSDYSPVYNLPFERLEGIMRHSAELGEQVYIPEVDYIQNKNTLQTTLIQYQPTALDCHSSQKSTFSTIASEQAVAIGPEGGWSQTDLQLFQTLGLVQLPGPVLPAWFASSQIWRW
jgi:RsmE family RNA methyltransferase